MNLHRAARDVALALLSAALLTLALPRFDLEPLAWIGLVPLLLALRHRGPIGTLALSLLTGMGFMMGVFYWINVMNGFTLSDFLMLAVYLGSYVGLFGLALYLVSRGTRLPALLTAPVLWVSFEYLRSNAGFLALPWGLLAHSQYLNLPLIQVSALTGAYGVSFLVVMVNVALAEAAASRLERRRPGPAHGSPRVLTGFAVVLIALGLCLVYGLRVISRSPPEPVIALTVIQGNVPQATRWLPRLRSQHVAKHVRLTTEATRHRQASLVVWPETALPGSLTLDLRLRASMAELAKATGTPLLVGSAARPKFGPEEFRRTHAFNSAFLISPTRGIAGQYNKLHLLPFAEYLPYKGSFPWPARLASVTGNFVPGNDYTVFDLDGTRFAVVICWESIFPDLVRQFVRRGAEFIVNITNEAWFGETAAPRQFLAMAVFRAVENRISVVRSANTGISSFIDPSGRIVGRVADASGKDVFVEGYLTHPVPLWRQRTFYTTYGDLFAHVNLLLSLTMVGVALLRLRRTPVSH